MFDEPLVSYAENAEDIVLWRALGHVEGGRYVDTGASDPDVGSVTRLLYDRGWRGTDVVRDANTAARFHRRRPHDDVVGSGEPGRLVEDVLAASASSGQTLHLLRVDLRDDPNGGPGVDLVSRSAPWVLVVRTAGPDSSGAFEHWESEVRAAGYELTLFDGLSRFHVSSDHPELAHRLGYPACPLDGFDTADQVELRAHAARLEEELQQAREQAALWRSRSVDFWANSMAHAQASEDAASVARAKAERARNQMRRAQRTLEEVRADRKRLRERVRRLSAAAAQQPEQAPAGGEPARSRLRSLVKKATGE